METFPTLIQKIFIFFDMKKLSYTSPKFIQMRKVFTATDQEKQNINLQPSDRNMIMLLTVLLKKLYIYIYIYILIILERFSKHCNKFSIIITFAFHVREDFYVLCKS